MKVIVTLLLLCFVGYAHGQQAFKGRVTDEAGKPLPMATITLLNGSQAVIAYSTTTSQGYYTLTLPAPAAAPLSLQVTYLGYKRQVQAVQASVAAYNFKLQAEATILPDIIIKNKAAINRLGDTLRYQVMSFARPEDRSIGDVLRRMPGIEIDDDGRISYNGKAISNLYIHGDDLMSGRYGLATRAVRKEDIIAVDVMRNHQPIRVNQGKEASEATALNLVLRNPDSWKLSGEVELSAGLPHQYNAQLTPIVLNQKFKLISSAALNNSGEDYARNFRQLGAANFITDIAAPPAVVNLSQGTIRRPNVPQPYYYRNHSALATVNAMVTQNKYWQYKVNLMGMVDKNLLDYNSRVLTYLPADTIAYFENQAVTNKPTAFSGTLNVMANKPGVYLNNALRFELDNHTDASTLNLGTQGFSQGLRRRAHALSNDFNLAPALGGKNTAEVRWLLSYNANSQQLRLGQGYVPALPGVAGIYSGTTQQLQQPTLFSNAYIAFKPGGAVLTQDYRLGYITERQDFTSNLFFTQNNINIPYTYSAGNNLHWHHSNLYAQAGFRLKLQKLDARLTLPVSLQRFSYSDAGYNTTRANTYWPFAPTAMVQYNFTVEQRLVANAGYSSMAGNITQVYRGPVLQNYRLLMANDADLQLTHVATADLTYQYEHAVSMLFAAASLTWQRVTAPTLASTVLTDSIQRSVVLPIPNSLNNTALQLSVSKYLPPLRLTGLVKGGVAYTSYRQLLNGADLPANMLMYNVNGSLTKRFYGFLSVDYKPAFAWSATGVGTTSVSGNRDSRLKTFAMAQELILGAHKYNYDLDFTGRHSYASRPGNVGQSYFFADATLRRKFTSPRVDLSLTGANLFNIKNYTVYNNYINQVTTSRYTLRGRMVMLTAELFL